MFVRIRTLKASLLAMLVGTCVGSYARQSKADVSSWLGLSAGVAQSPGFDFDQSMVPTLRLGTGMGTDPSHPWIVGGMFRVDTLFGRGTDLSFMVRLANHGYVNGDWGIAVDAGPLARLWGPDTYGGAAVVTVGGPWGLEAGLNGSLGNEHASGIGCFIGIDLARLTVYRRTGASWWKNTFPAYRTPEEQTR